MSDTGFNFGADDTEPIGADDIVRAAEQAVGDALLRKGVIGPSELVHDDMGAPARASTAAVLRALARDGDTWEPDVLDALADEIGDGDE